jgi:hypothetical protein
MHMARICIGIGLYLHYGYTGIHIIPISSVTTVVTYKKEQNARALRYNALTLNLFTAPIALPLRPS